MCRLTLFGRFRLILITGQVGIVIWITASLRVILKWGNDFLLKPKDLPAVKIRLTEIHEGYSFTDCTLFFGAKMFNTHRIDIKDEGTILSNKFVVTGPLKWLWIKLVAEKVADSIPEEMDALAHLAQRYRVYS